MRYLVTAQHLRFFSEHGIVELDPLVLAEDLAILEEALKLHPNGRDLFRYGEAARKLLCSKKLGEIAAALFKENPLLIAYAQYPFSIEKEQDLESISCFSHLAGGLLLNLEHSFFVAPNHPLPLFQGLLIAYATLHTRYRPNSIDPAGHELKKLGYGSGDRLRMETHPIVSR